MLSIPKKICRNRKRPGLAVLVGVGRCHGLRLHKRKVLEFAHAKYAECIADSGALRLHAQIDGRDQMLRRQRLAGLRHNFERGAFGNKENETGGFALRIGFAEPAVA